ncbi:hypothetical protein SLE2022_254030 [Rubroshorea leprosula]
MLDEHRLDIGSERFAELVGDAGNKGALRLLFCIGGPYGRGRQIQERANISVIFDGLESSNYTCCARGTTLQVMEYSEGAEVPSLDISLFLNHSMVAWDTSEPC